MNFSLFISLIFCFRLSLSKIIILISACCVSFDTFFYLVEHFVLLERLLNCFVRWNEFQVFNDHVISIHKYSMTFSHKLSIKLNWNVIKKSIKDSNFICFLCTFRELYGWNQQCCKFIYCELTPLLMTIIIRIFSFLQQCLVLWDYTASKEFSYVLEKHEKVKY